MILLNEKSRELFDLLFQSPPKFEDAEKLVKSEKHTSEELTKVAINFAEQCRFEISNALFEKEITPQTNPLGIVEGYCSAYLYKVLEFLIQYGIDANAVFENDRNYYNLMSSVMWVDNGYVAADSMGLLLENGGNPNLLVDDESVFDEFTFDVFFGAIEQEKRRLYECWVHTWFVLLAFGGDYGEGSLFKEYGKDELFALHKLKDHRNYAFCLSRGADGPIVRIFDKDTFWEVACF